MSAPVGSRSVSTVGDSFSARVHRLPRKLRTAGVRLRLPPAVRSTIDRVRADHLTFLTAPRLTRLAQACRATANLQGVIIEAGCAQGGSAIVLAAVKKATDRLEIYDVFGLIPPPSERDGRDCHDDYARIASGRAEGLAPGHTYYGYIDNLKDAVKASFARYGYDAAANNVYLVQGLVQDTLHPTGPVKLAHIDVDWYDPVMVSLERLEPRLVVGGVIQLDDYFDYSGCHDATDAYFAGKDRSKYHFESWTGALTITKLN